MASEIPDFRFLSCFSFLSCTKNSEFSDKKQDMVKLTPAYFVGIFVSNSPDNKPLTQYRYHVICNNHSQVMKLLTGTSKSFAAFVISISPCYSIILCISFQKTLQSFGHLKAFTLSTIYQFHTQQVRSLLVSSL